MSSHYFVKENQEYTAIFIDIPENKIWEERLPNRKANNNSKKRKEIPYLEIFKKNRRTSRQK